MKKNYIFYKHPPFPVAMLMTAVFLFSAIVPVCSADEPEQEEDSRIIWFSDAETHDDFSRWETFGGDLKLEQSSSKFHSGKYSIKASEREKSFSGPSFSITDVIDRDKNYILDLYAAYSCNVQDKIRITLKTTDDDGTDTFTTITDEENKPADEWIHIREPFLVPADAAEAVIYAESSRNDSIIWIDDVSVIAGDISEESKITHINRCGTTEYTFESNTYADITPVRNSSVLRTDALAADGNYSLRVCNRSDSRDGVALDISSLLKDIRFRCSSFITFTEKHHNEEKFAMYLEYHIGGTLYNIAVDPECQTQRGSWAVIGGEFTVPPDAEDAKIIINSVRPEDEYNYTHVSFLLDNLTVTDNLVTNKDKLESQKRTRLYVIFAISGILLTSLILAVISIRLSSQKKIEAASRDSMTNAYNRNAYETKIELLSKKPEKCKNLFFAVCDVNGLKLLNDNFGHHTGDECIIKCADVLASVMQQAEGKVYRIGGDEFVCIAGKPFRDILSEAIRQETEKNSEYPFSIAAGYASYSSYEDGDPPDIRKIIARCDREMYIDKKKAQKFHN